MSVPCDMILMCVENVPAVELAEKAIAYGVHSVTTGEAAGAQTLRDALESGAMATRQLLALSSGTTAGDVVKRAEVPKPLKKQVPSFDIEDLGGACAFPRNAVPDDAIVCRCERVAAGRIR